MNAYHVIGDGVIHQEMDDEVVIINLETGTYYQLNAPAAWLWKGIETQIAVTMLPAWFCSRYQADPESITPLLQAFLLELQQENLIIPGNANENAIMPKPLESGQLPCLAPALSKFTDMQDLLLLDPIHEVDESGWPNKA